MIIKGTARVGSVTKLLARRINPGEIAVIDHFELDDLAAQNLIDARVRAVVNASPSISERYPNGGPYTLVSSGVALLDNVGRDIMKMVRDGETVEITENRFICNGRVVASGELLSLNHIKKVMEVSRSNMQGLIYDFVCNTLDYARNEMGLITGMYKMPEIETEISGKHVLIVVRGRNYKDDLNAIRHYIDEVSPVLAGVDGGADALMGIGLIPDLIIGDMDSVSDETLHCGAELVAHAYRNGESPGYERLKRIGLSAKVFAAPGTSEDIAMLLAHEMGAELIVLVGSHSNIQDFLDKGRKGMASTFLVRLKIGTKLVDAKGVSKLYKSKVMPHHLLQIFLAAMIPAILVISLSPPFSDIFRLAYLQLKILLGI